MAVMSGNPIVKLLTVPLFVLPHIVACCCSDGDWTNMSTSGTLLPCCYGTTNTGVFSGTTISSRVVEDIIIFSEDSLPIESIEMDFTKCLNATANSFSSKLGEIIGLLGPDTDRSRESTCVLKIQVPEQEYLLLRFEVFHPCTSDFFQVVETLDNIFNPRIDCDSSTTVWFAPDWIAIHWIDGYKRTRERVRFRLRFQATKQPLLETLNGVFTSPFSGYITTLGFHGNRIEYPFMEATYSLIVPDNHVVMISLAHYYDPTRYGLTIFNQPIDKSLSGFLQFKRGTAIYNTSLLIMYKSSIPSVNFKMLFSIHAVSEAPSFFLVHYFLLSTPIFNCSVSHYVSFKQHLECNFEPECQGGEDEGGHCPFSPPECNGSVGWENKCYVVLTKYRTVSSNTLTRPCEDVGGSLAMMKTKSEWQAFWNVFHYRDVRKFGIYQNQVIIGMKMFDGDGPDYYRKSFIWLDNTVAYEVNLSLSAFLGGAVWAYADRRHFIRTFLSQSDIQSGINSQKFLFACQLEVAVQDSAPKNKIQLAVLENAFLSMSAIPTLTKCTQGHVTREFLSCDPENQFGTERFSLDHKLSATDTNTDTKPMVAMFVCSPTSTLHYTFVCDFRADCEDGSDESFCEHRQDCEGFSCKNGQCVSLENVCDDVKNCLDGSDEDQACEKKVKTQIYRLPPPAVVNFEYDGTVKQERLELGQTCPETHFQCPGVSSYCLPVYVRCNGVYDCVGHEDEADCDSYTCQGFYRCRSSIVCIHLDHLCDGWPQCPQRDDEFLCDLMCPEGCHCQGVAFVCRRAFPLNHYPELRYLDGADSGINPRDLVTNTYLVWLSLASCSISSFPDIHLPNLQTLDLSDNRITSVSLTTFHLYRNLQVLKLSRNPVNVIHGATSSLQNAQLKWLDLSGAELSVFDSATLGVFANTEVLNMSFGKLTMITNSGFSYLPNLQTLDLRGNFLRHLPTHMLKELASLRVLYSDNYELCCDALLPQAFDRRFCFAPNDEISSCEDLLLSGIYRVSLWLIGLTSIAGNAGSFVYRLFSWKRTSRSGFNVFVTSLCLADLLMGVYLAMIGAADILYLNSYVEYKAVWTNSIPCKIAGFLALLSSEVSAFMIAFVTLDRCIVIRFPFSLVHFRTWSALLACTIVWVGGTLLAGVPLTPVLSNWDFYSQSGVCLPLPITKKKFGGRLYSFSVMVVLNFALFLLIALGQAFIYWSVRLNTLTTDTSKRARDLTIARRLITVAVSDFLCWFPIGLLGLMSSAGVAIPGELNIITAVFVLPLNSALNPFLYTYGVIAEKRRKAKERSLLEFLEKQTTSEVLD